MVAILEVQNGRRRDVWANENIVFLIPLVAPFSKMYSFTNPHKKMYNRPYYIAAILKIQNGRHTVLWANGNIDFLILHVITFPKMYSFKNPQENPTNPKILT